MKKKNILFYAMGGKQWIAGLHYIKIIIYMLLQHERTKEHLNIYILVHEEHSEMFKKFNQYPFVKLISYPKNTILSKFNRVFWAKRLDLSLLMAVQKYNIDYVYPVKGPFWGLNQKSIYWIPDFQHVHLPKFFSRDQIEYRDKTYRYIAKNHKILMLSSQDAKNDFKNLFPRYTGGVHVLRFVSSLEMEISPVTTKIKKETIDKYKLNKEYIYIPNQFWAHKNHIVAFKAIHEIVNNRKKKIHLICTGNKDDYRNRKHFNYLMKYLDDHSLHDYIDILGFVSREEQVVIMQQAKMLMQPSLFEGWGIAVEEAKTLDKRIIISDLPIHQEQKDHHCILFEKNNPIDLANKIEEEWTRSYESNSRRGIEYTKRRAWEYVNEFLSALTGESIELKVKNTPIQQEVMNS